MQLSWLHNESVNLRLEETGELAILHCRLADEASGRQSVELTLTIVVLGIRALLGESWRPQLICFPHAPPRSREMHRRVFNCELAFNQDVTSVVFSRRDLDMAIPDADPALAREIARYIEGLAGFRRVHLADRVEELVFATLASGHCTAERLSETLGFDRRTLHRRLAREGATFSKIVDRARTRLAKTYLKDRQRNLTAVSGLLGFSSLSAFSRWHRDKFGRAATDARNRS